MPTRQKKILTIYILTIGSLIILLPKSNAFFAFVHDGTAYSQQVSGFIGDQVQYIRDGIQQVKNVVDGVKREFNQYEQMAHEIEMIANQAQQIYQIKTLLEYNGNPLDYLNKLDSYLGLIQDTRDKTIGLYESTGRLKATKIVLETHGAYENGRFIPSDREDAIESKYDQVEQAIEEYQTNAEGLNFRLNTVKMQREEAIKSLDNATTVTEISKEKAKYQLLTDNYNLILKEMEDNREHVKLMDIRRENLDKKRKEVTSNQSFFDHYVSVAKSYQAIANGGDGADEESSGIAESLNLDY